jgi:hypothetical protein
MSKGYSCYLFDRIPGAWSKWTLAVFATSLSDARNYIRATHMGAKYIGEVTGRDVQANCGAVTEGAQNQIRAKLESEV